MDFRKVLRTPALIVGIFLISSTVNANVIYYEDFEDGATDLSGSGGLIVGSGNFDAASGDVLGSNFFRNDSTGKPRAGASSVDIGGLSGVSTIEISFILLAIDSWDGSTSNGGTVDPDYFNVEINSGSVFSETIDFEILSDGSITSTTSADVSIISSGTDLGFNSGWEDTIYGVSFVVTGSFTDPTNLSFFASGNGWQGGHDESWGIDNLKVKSVSAPATVLLFSLSIIGVFLRKRLM